MKKAFLSIFCLFVIFLGIEKSQAKSWGVRVDPLFLLEVGVSGQIDIGLGQKWTFSPMFTVWNVSSTDISFGANAYGLRLDYYFNRNFSDSWYLGPFAYNMAITVKTKDTSTGDQTGEAIVSTPAYGMAIGYLWQWTHFYQSLGLKSTVVSSTKATVKKEDGTQTEETIPSSFGGARLEWLMGFSF